ncbi:MAG: hypothetical protein ACRDFS_05520 [Chloroflexota bacterium]
MRARPSKPKTLLIAIIVLWLLGVVFLSSAWIAGLVLLIPGLFLLGLCCRQAWKGNWGAAAAWAGCSYAPLAIIAIFALGNIHVHEFTGGGATCDAMAQDCNPQVAQGIAHSLSLAALVATGILTLRFIRVARHEEEALLPLANARK